MRDYVAHGTPLGSKIAATFTENWQPLADDLTLEVVHMATAGKNGFVLDGFPRNVHQAQSMNILDDVDAVVWLRVSEDICRERVLARQRSDDSALKFETRLHVESERMPALLDYMRSHYRFVAVDADGTVDEVSKRIVTALTKGGEYEKV